MIKTEGLVAELGSFPKTRQTLERALQEHGLPGAVGAVWNYHSDEEPWIHAVGHRRIFPSSQDLLKATVFDLASLTKPLVTTTLIARLVERGLLDWQTSITSILTDAPKEWSRVQIWHLLSHSAGFQAWAPFWQVLREKWGDSLSGVPVFERQEAVREQVYRHKLETDPGSRTVYSDLSFLLLGFIIEQILGERLDRVWNSLGFRAAYRVVHRPPQKTQPIDESIAATEKSDWRGGILQGEVHDENCWAMGGIAGHAGLFGSAIQVVEIVNAIFREKLFSKAVSDVLYARLTPKAGSPRTLGWDLPAGDQSSAGKGLSARRGVVGHLGFTGTSLWVDRQSGWSFLLLTQRVHLGRENLGIRPFRILFHEAAFADLGIDRFSGFRRA